MSILATFESGSIVALPEHPTRAELLAQVERQHQAMQALLESFNEIVAERDAALLLNELCHY